MLICNPFKATEWKFTTLFRIILAFQLSLYGLICLDNMNIDIPILRQFICFVYLTFIPGILIIRILKLDNSDTIEVLVYTLGFSILFIMFLGFVVNFLYLLIGINKPISETILAVTINTAIFLLCFVNYLQKERTENNPSFHLYYLFSTQSLLLFSLPLLSIWGTYYVNFHNNNVFLMIFLFLIAVIFLFAINDKFITQDLYGPLIYLTSLSLLFHRSLISPYIIGADIHVEYYFSNLVQSQGYWNPTIENNVNSMLSIAMLAPIYSVMCNLSLTWVFKIIFPFIFAFLPLGLYSIYHRQIGEKIAFLSTFYFISILTFYTEMISIARQQIAEIFFMLILFVMISDQKIIKKRFMLILFSFGLAVSHYGLSYLIIVFGIFAYIFLTYGLRCSSDTFRLSFLVVYVIFALSWYMNNSGGYSFKIVVSLFSHVLSTIGEEVLDTSSTTLATNLSTYYSGVVLKILYLVSQFFIIIGFSNVLYEQIIERKEPKFRCEYLSFAALFLVMLFAAALTSSTGMNIKRLFHIASIVLSPFVYIGFLTLIGVLETYFKKVFSLSSFFNLKFLFNLFGLILVLFFLLNSGFIQELIKEEPKSISLSQSRMEISNENINFLYVECTNEFDVHSILWTSNHINKNFPIYSDLSTKVLPFESYGGIWRDECVLSPTINEVPEKSYIYLGYLNTHYGLINGPLMFKDFWNIDTFVPLLNKKNLLYSNGGSKLYN